MQRKTPAPKSLLDEPLKLEPGEWQAFLKREQEQQQADKLPIPVLFPYDDTSPDMPPLRDFEWEHVITAYSWNERPAVVIRLPGNNIAGRALLSDLPLTNWEEISASEIRKTGKALALSDFQNIFAKQLVEPILPKKEDPPPQRSDHATANQGESQKGIKQAEKPPSPPLNSAPTLNALSISLGWIVGISTLIALGFLIDPIENLLELPASIVDRRHNESYPTGLGVILFLYGAAISWRVGISAAYRAFGGRLDAHRKQGFLTLLLFLGFATPFAILLTVVELNLKSGFLKYALSGFLLILLLALTVWGFIAGEKVAKKVFGRKTKRSFHG